MREWSKGDAATRDSSDRHTPMLHRSTVDSYS